MHSLFLSYYLFHLLLLPARGEKKKKISKYIEHLESLPIEGKLLVHVAPQRVQREV